MKRGQVRRLDALATDGVERGGPTEPPKAFRIWKAGSNVTDHGPTLFSERSAKLLLAEQAKRGNRYSIDVDHASLDKDAPIENHRAVGWFSIAVRDGELWAVDVEWTDTVRAGLTKDPPEWKYHSPAYDVDKDTGEVVSLLNLAITNNPATHAVTALASRRAKVTSMKWSDIKAALDGDDEDMKAAAYAAIQAAFPDEKGDGDEKKDAEDEPEKKDSKAAEDEPEKKDSKAAEDEPSEKDAIAAALAKVNTLASEVEALKKDKAESERKSLLASRPDFKPELVTILAKAPIEMVRDAVKRLPREATKVASTETVTATRGDGQGDGKAGRLPSDERRALDERMGIVRQRATIKREGIRAVFPVMTQEDARAARAALAKKGDVK